jgi:LacI family transcriptional regulator
MSVHHVTQKQIAEALGVSTQTVSLALRWHTKISAATRKRVREKAEELGYTPDPGLRALADYRSGKQKVSTRWSEVALLHNWPSEEEWHGALFYQRWRDALQTEAQNRGIRISEFWLGGKGERSSSVFRQLRNRGISGVFIAPLNPGVPEPVLAVPRQGFQVVTFGPEHVFPDYHTVQFDFYENLRLAWKVLWERGCRKIGLMYLDYHGWRTGHAWPAAYYVENLLAGCIHSKPGPLVLGDECRELRRQAYLDWVTQGEFDAVISSYGRIHEWNMELKKPPEVAMLNVQPGEVQGVDLNLPHMAEIAVELLYMDMQNSLTQRKSPPFRIHVPGVWVDASTSAEAG